MTLTPPCAPSTTALRAAVPLPGFASLRGAGKREIARLLSCPAKRGRGTARRSRVVEGARRRSNAP